MGGYSPDSCIHRHTFLDSYPDCFGVGYSLSMLGLLDMVGHALA